MKSASCGYKERSFALFWAAAMVKVINQPLGAGVAPAELRG
jgi:hypothetical protein